MTIRNYSHCSFILGLGITWSVFYHTLNHIKTTGFPSNPRIFWEGWLFILLGYTVYLSTALCAITPTRWYTTRLFPLAFAALLYPIVLSQWNIVLAYALLLSGLAILFIQITDTFSTTEF